METTMNNLQPSRTGRWSRGQRKREQTGFTLLEVMIAGAILTVGLMALLGLFTTALASTQSTQMDEIARERAMQALESIYTARQTSQLTFADINNTTAGGKFLPGMIQLGDPGPDGLDDTADDITPPASYVLPGPDGLLSTTADNVTISLSNFQRQVTITNALTSGGAPDPNLKQVVVTVQYPGSTGRMRPYTVQALVSSFR